MKFKIIVLSAILLSLFICKPTLAANYSHIISLSSGWNLISTPRIVESHQFSAPETLANFSIYLQSSTSASGWKTMSEVGQSEFTPLYGYFIYNNTGASQTLTLNYKQSNTPSARMFSRPLSIGWNVLGVANPSYALKQKDDYALDNNNVQNILNSINSSVSNVSDLTASSTKKDSVAISNSWNQKVFSEANQLDDFRETKAYAVYLNSASDYDGFQNDDEVVIDDESTATNTILISENSYPYSAQNVTGYSKNNIILQSTINAREAVTANGLNIRYSSEGDVASTTNQFENIKVYVNDFLIDSFSTATSTSIISKTIDGLINLHSGDNQIQVTADVKDNASSSAAFRVILDNNIFTNKNIQYSSSGNPVASSSISGFATSTIITVTSPNLTLFRNDGYSQNKKIVQGSSNVSLGKFALEAIDGAIKLTSIVIGENIGDESGVNTSTPASSIYDMKIFIDGVQVGSTRDFTSSGATFSSLNYSVAKDTTKNIELFGSFDSSAADVASTTFKATTTVNAQDSLGKTITAQSAETTQFRVTIGGTLSVAKAADTVGANILIANATEQEIAKFKFTAVDDSANITEFSVINTSSAAAADSRVSSYKLYLGSTLLDEATPFNGTTTFNISGSKLVVPTNGSQTVTIKAVFNSISVKADSGKGIKLQIEEESITAKSSSGTELNQSAIIDLTVVANEMVIRTTKPTFAQVNGFVGGASVNQEVLRFTIAADANEDLKVTALTFAEYGSAIDSVSTYTLYEVSDSAAISRTGTDHSFTGMDIQIAKGTSKTFKLIANTGSLITYDTFGVTLENSTVANIGWGEYFIDGYTTADGASLSVFPINGGIKIY